MTFVSGSRTPLSALLHHFFTSPTFPSRFLSNSSNFFSVLFYPLVGPYASSIFFFPQIFRLAIISHERCNYSIYSSKRSTSTKFQKISEIFCFRISDEIQDITEVHRIAGIHNVEKNPSSFIFIPFNSSPGTTTALRGIWNQVVMRVSVLRRHTTTTTTMTTICWRRWWV